MVSQIALIESGEAIFDLGIDQTLTPESSLPEISAAPSFVNRSTLTRR